MNHSGARKISEVTRAVEPAFRVPGPVRDGREDTARDDDGVDEIRQELTSLCYRPGNNRGRGRRKHKLKSSSFLFPTFVVTRHLEEPFRIGIIGELVVEILRSSTEQVSPSSIGQTPPDSPVRQSSYEGVQHVLYQNVHGVLGSDRPSFKECKAALHEENNDGHDQQEELVTFSSERLPVMFCLV